MRSCFNVRRCRIRAQINRKVAPKICMAYGEFRAIYVICPKCLRRGCGGFSIIFTSNYNSRCSVHGFHVNRVASSHGVCANVQITPIKCFSCIQVKLGQCLSEWGSSWSLPRYYWREATLARRFSVGIFSLKFSFRSWLVQILYYSAILLFRFCIIQIEVLAIQIL